MPATSTTQSSNKLLVTGLVEQYAQEADLQRFLKTPKTDLDLSTTFSLEILDGGSHLQSPSDTGVEADMDVQHPIGIALGVPTIFLSGGGDSQDGGLEGFLDVGQYLLAEDTSPQVMASIYGRNKNTTSIALVVQLCNAYAQLSARGMTLSFASGDGGVAGSQSSSCTDFLLTFPSDRPYMTSVGAFTGTSPEAAASFLSGGFFKDLTAPDHVPIVSAYVSPISDTYSGCTTPPTAASRTSPRKARTSKS